ncbi:MAG: ABC transporter ATP-binding protein [Candidatus Moranbacteria bacterium]|nr:ABC transporter ATP-binding protein [Candidatus Moranbacteria bacterium]
MSKSQNQKTENLIEVERLNVIYNKSRQNEVKALENVDLTIKPQEWVIVFGPSGCGKSTLLNSIAGLETPTSGKVKVRGGNINSLDSDEKALYRQNEVGMVFQSFHLINSLNVLENVCLPQIFLGADAAERRRTAKEHLARFGIADQGGKYPSQISGGQKQKVSIARALMNEPGIILADEPVGNLDSKSAYNVMTILKELNEIDKKTIIMVTHDRNHLKYADKVVYVKDGKVIKTEIIKKKKAKTDEKGKKREIETKTKVPVDLKLLMDSFKDLSFSQINRLMEPFKVKQTFSYLMLPITNHQAEIAQERIKQYFLGNIDKEKLKKELDKKIEDGGAGWDKRNAGSFVEDLSELVEEAGKIDYSATYQSAIRLAEYMAKKFSLKKSEFEFNLLKNSISERLKNKASMNQLKDVLDRPEEEGGLGLDKRTAEKIARELEIIILIRYSG